MTIAPLLVALALPGQALVPVALPAPGPYRVGYAVEAIASHAAPLMLHLWYPAAGCANPLTFGDYVGGEGDPRFEEIRPIEMRACRDAAALPGRHAVLIGRHDSGAWPLQAEHFASHGYIVAMVASRGTRITATGDERARQIAALYEGMADEMETALAHVTARNGDAARVGVLGAGVAPMLFAMRSPQARAVSMQDSRVFGGGPTADALRHAPSWQPARMPPRLLFVPPGEHDDLASSGYLLRRKTGADDPRQRAFVDVLDAQRRFFDAFVREGASR